MRTLRTMAVMVSALAALGGCASPGKTTVDVGASAYARAFESAKDVLREQGYELERVDAREGVITTKPRSSSGLLTPWVTDEQSPGDELASTMHWQRRRVDVRFSPAEGGERPEDMREVGGPVRAAVDASVERVYQPGVRVGTASIRTRHVYDDPLREGAGGGGLFAVDQGSDRRLATLLAKRIRNRLTGDSPSRLRPVP